MRILLTGGSGFIGRHLKARLSLDHEIYAPASAELNLLSAQAVDAYFAHHAVDAIIHSACIGVQCTGSRCSQSSVEANITMYKNLARHSSVQCKLINLGSGAEYDKSRALHNIAESEFGKRIPTDPYGRAKYEISCLIGQNKHAYNLRLFGVYGPGERKERFMTAACISHLSGESFHMNCDTFFDFLEVSDCCKIVERVLVSPPATRQFNVCPTQSHSLKELAFLVSDIVGYRVPIRVSRTGLSQEYTGDNSLLLLEYPDLTFTPIEQGIRRLLASMA